VAKKGSDVKYVIYTVSASFHCEIFILQCIFSVFRNWFYVRQRIRIFHEFLLIYIILFLKIQPILCFSVDSVLNTLFLNIYSELTESKSLTDFRSSTKKSSIILKDIKFERANQQYGGGTRSLLTAHAKL